MTARRTLTEWVSHHVRGVGSLASAALIVSGVMAFAVYSMAAPSAQDRVATTGGDVPPAAGRTDATAKRGDAPTLYITAVSKRPIALTAQVRVHGWKNRTQRVVDAEIGRVERVQRSKVVAQAPAVDPEGQISEQLTGQRVLASVSDSAAKVLPEHGQAVVALVVTPMGETATLVIDEVIEANGVRPAASTAEVDSAVITAAANATYVATAASPRVLTLSRYWGAPGTVVTMTGERFGRSQGSSWVTCGGVKAAVVSWRETKIVFKVPKGMRAQGYVGVVKGKRPSNGLYFSPFTPPLITSIAPREGAPGTTVTLRGRHFGKRQADGWVTFAGSTAQVVSWSDTSISVVVPRDATGGYAGVVAHGMTSNGVLYGPLGAPLVRSVSARVLLPGSQVTLTGRSFGPKRGTVVVGGARVAADSWSPTEVRFTVTAGMSAGYVGVIRNDGWTSNGIWVPWAPRVDSVSTWWTRPNSEVTLTGAAFGATQGDRNVYIGGVRMAVSSWSDTAITARVPSYAQSGYVGVGTPSGCSNGKWVVVETPAQITSVMPYNGVAEGEMITISGSGFGSPSAAGKVVIGGRAECSVVSWSDRQIVAVLPAITETTYVGVLKHGVSSNGVWVTPRAVR